MMHLRGERPGVGKGNASEWELHCVTNDDRFDGSVSANTASRIDRCTNSVRVVTILLER